MQGSPSLEMTAAPAAPEPIVVADDAPLPDPVPRLTEAEQDRDRCVTSIEDELARACGDEDVCYYASHAFSVLGAQFHKRDLLAISTHQASRLRTRLDAAREAILPYFEEDELRYALAGFSGAQHLVAWWALSKQRRRLQSPHARREHRLRLRWLQNALHNQSIVDELTEDAALRRGKLIATIKANAGASK